MTTKTCNIPTNATTRAHLDELAEACSMSRSAFLDKLVELAGDEVRRRLTEPVRVTPSA